MRKVTNTADGKTAWVNPSQVAMVAPARDEKGAPIVGYSLVIMAGPHIAPLGCKAIQRTVLEVGLLSMVQLPSHDGVPVYVNPGHVAAVVASNTKEGHPLVGECALFWTAPHLAPLRVGMAMDDAAKALGGTAEPLVTLA